MRSKLNDRIRFASPIAIMMLLAGLTSCDSAPPEHGNLQVFAGGSRLSADGSDTVPFVQYNLTLAVRNETIYQNAPESFDVCHRQFSQA